MKTNCIVTISRQFGSGGRMIGKLLAERLGVPFYDNELISLAAEESGIHKNILENAEDSPGSSLLYSLSMGVYASAARADLHNGLALNDRVYLVQSKVIRKVADDGPCVIVGRCADYILAGRKDTIHVFICSDLQSRVHRAKERYGMTGNNMEATVQKTDKRRAAYYNYYTAGKWGAAENYHISLNSDFLGIDHTVDLLCTLVQQRSETLAQGEG